MKILSFTMLCLLIITIPTQAKIIRVPADQPTIQAGIDASVNGDTVVVYPGTYFENIIFNGKKIVLTSRFYENFYMSFITSTIINGSKPSDPNKASCVRIINGEDETTILQGFTITRGMGTAWPDEHSPGTYIEGGGILTAFTAPVIQFNVIAYNEAIAKPAGIASAGEGAIRSGDGNPKILNNVIMFNKGKYGAGIVLNYCGGTLRNNLVFGNTGGESYGGGGIWVNGSNVNSKIIENNTIVGNHSALDGGGILVYNSPGTFIGRNNIIWGNTAGLDPSISPRDNSGLTLTFSNVQGGWNGAGNIDIDPMFADSGLYLQAISPCVDAGDSNSVYNDPNYGINPELAAPPAHGTIRNDMGAYGGPFAKVNPEVWLPKFSSATAVGFGNVQLGKYETKFSIANIGARILDIDRIIIKNNFKGNLSLSGSPSALHSIQRETVIVVWNAVVSERLSDSILIYHRDTSTVSPFALSVTGNAFTIVKLKEGTMYAASGATDTGKVYSVNPSNGAPTLIGKSGFTTIVSLRTNPVTKELVALASSGTLVRMSSEEANNLPLSTITLANAKGITFKDDGTLYVGQFNGNLSAVNISTGEAKQVASTGLKISGLAFNPVSGELWASVRPTSSGKDNIYKIALPQGTATLVGTTGFGIPTKDITFDAKGKLYGVVDTTGKNSYLITIDTANGKGTVIGDMGVKGMEAIELNSYFITSVAQEKNNEFPRNYALEQNYPNPFNPSTHFQFSIADFGFVNLKIFDMLGREVATIVNENLSAGVYKVQFDASHLSSGVYFYKLEAGNFAAVKKFTLIK